MLSVIRLLAVAVILAATTSSALAQHVLNARVLDAHEGTPLPGVNVVVVGTQVGATTDEEGVVRLTSVPSGRHVVRFSFVGYAPVDRTLEFPRVDPEELLIVRLEEEHLELEEATVTATRTSRTIADTPTRVETIGAEEISEKIAMDPSGISMVLTESPGIVVRQTSAVSASGGFEIQGLDGRYTQLLRDGFPLYGGLGGGLSILQIPPLDLQQVEVIKGPVSTLYGGDAIAGLVNLVTKTPTEEGERSILLNATSAGGVDAAAYLARRNQRHGYTLLATGNLQRAYDAEGDEFTNLPATRRFTFTPNYFHYGRGTLRLGLSATGEVRAGGYLDAVTDDGEGFTERNVSARITALGGWERPIGEHFRLNVRSSGSYFDRDVTVPAFRSGGVQFTTYSEASLAGRRAAHDVIAGADVRTDRFDPVELDRAFPDFSHGSVGIFAQDTWDVLPELVVESGLRLDVHSEYGLFPLPRVSLLVRPTNQLSFRAGGGLGYKVPTPFLEDAEVRAYRAVELGDEVEPERSIGGNVDVNFRSAMGPLAITLNQLFYVTRLTNPLTTFEDVAVLRFATGDGNVTNWGSETTVRLLLSDFKLFLGYVYLNARRNENGASFEKPLAAHHRTYSVLVWEQHDRGRIGLEAYYTGSQHLPDGGDSPGYLITGIMVMWRFGDVRVFANLENFLDALQSRSTPLVLGTPIDPTFPPVWGPTDGFVANAGFVVEF